MSNESDTIKEVAAILRDNIQFSGQIGDYVITGAVEKLIKWREEYADLHNKDKDMVIGFMEQKINLLQKALREIRDFDEDSEWDNPGEIAKDALKIQ